MCDPLSPGKKGWLYHLKANSSPIDFWDTGSLLTENFDGVYPK